MFSIRYGAKGPNSATATACSASAHSIGDAYKIIQRCAAEVMIAGGSEAAIRPWAWAALPPCARFPRATTNLSAPAAHSDAQRDGFIVGEGAAF
jgi:3-oxoacyl-[acyl-carrier-protein] synthase II